MVDEPMPLSHDDEIRLGQMAATLRGSRSSATNPRSPRRRSQPRRLSRTRLEVEKSKSQKVEKSKGPSPARGSVGIRFRDSGSGSGRDSVRDGYRDGGRHRPCGAGRTRGMTPFLPLRWCRGGSRRPACGLMGDAAVTANPQAGRLWPPSLAPARARCRYRCRIPAVGNDNDNGLGLGTIRHRGLTRSSNRW